MRYIVMFLVMAGWCAGATWNDDSAIASKVRTPLGVFRSNLVGGGASEIATTGKGVYLHNGSICIAGGKITGQNDAMVGIDDVGLFALNTVSSVQTLQKSTDGVTAFADVLLPADGLRGTYLSSRQLIDCGRHTISGTEKRVLLFCEYVTGTNDFKGRIWISAEETNANAGNNATWSLLFGAVECGAVRHFHGGTYIKNKGLYLFTGDDTTAASILFCAEADMGTFLTTPAGYYAADHWALENAAARSGWAADKKSAYVLWGYSQQARTVEFLTADGRFAYFIPDREPIIGETFTSQNIIKVDLYDTTDSAAGKVSILTSGLANVGWFGGVSKSGMIYLSTYTKYATTDWMTGHNGLTEVYALDPETERVQKVKTLTPGTIAANRWYGLYDVLYEFGGAMFTRLYGYHAIDATDYWSDRDVLCGRVDKQKEPETNVLTNGSFTSAYTSANGWTVDTASNVLCVTGGKTAGIAVADTVTGATSGATAVVSTMNMFACLFTAEADDDFITTPITFFANNDTVRVLAATGATLPGNLSYSTTYYVVETSGAKFKLSTSSGGAAVNLSTDGSGTYLMIKKFTNVPATDNPANFASDVAVGFVRLTSCSGLFSAAGEVLNVGGTERATLTGFMTREIIADPTGQIGGNVLRVAQKSVFFEWATTITASLSAAQKALISGNVATFSARVYLHSTSDAGATVTPNVTCYPAAISSQSRYAYADMDKSIWQTWFCTSYIPTTASTHLYYISPNTTYSGAYTLYYMTDFQLINSAIPNSYIQRLKAGSSSGGLMPGRMFPGN
jgi:hypothetical protein